MKEKTKKKAKSLFYILFGKRKETTLADFRFVSPMDSANGVDLMLDSRNGKLYTKKELPLSYAEKYRRMKKRPIVNTPKVHFVDEGEEVLTVIEEYIPGDSMQNTLDKCGSLPEHKVLDVALQLCTILSDSHKSKFPVVNRDIVPSNIKMNRNGIVKLLDLVTVNRKDANADPNQGVAEDIRSMGVLINQLYTGQKPEAAMAEGALGDVVRNCLEGKYESAVQLQSALKELWCKLPKLKKMYNWRRYLLPGFRGKNVYLTLFAAVGYPLLVYLSIVMKFENAGPMTVLFRIAFLVAVLALVFFNGNYMGIHRKLPLTKSRFRFVRWMGVIIVDAVILALLYGLLIACGVNFGF